MVPLAKEADRLTSEMFRRARREAAADPRDATRPVAASGIHWWVMETDRAMLNAYVNGGEESSFARLVELHLGMVYSACRRMLGDGHAAEDAAQAVFILLAQKASSLKSTVVLAGWLHTTA